MIIFVNKNEIITKQTRIWIHERRHMPSFHRKNIFKPIIKALTFDQWKYSLGLIALRKLQLQSPQVKCKLSAFDCRQITSHAKSHRNKH